MQSRISVASLQNNKQAILPGFKEKIHIEDAMPGDEFCELTELDYERILEN